MDNSTDSELHRHKDARALLGVTEEEMKRNNAMKKMGMTEEEFARANEILAEATRTEFKALGTKTEEIIGYTTQQIERKKAVDLLGVTEEVTFVFADQVYC
jgi:hypothetical protein